MLIKYPPWKITSRNIQSEPYCKDPNWNCSKLLITHPSSFYTCYKENTGLQHKLKKKIQNTLHIFLYRKNIFCTPQKHFAFLGSTHLLLSLRTLLGVSLTNNQTWKVLIVSKMLFQYFGTSSRTSKHNFKQGSLHFLHLTFVLERYC